MQQIQDDTLAETQLSPAASSTHGGRGWSLLHRVVFRFAVVYFGLNIFPFPVDVPFIPYTHSLFRWYEELWKAVVPWVGYRFLHIKPPMVTFQTGSGDKTFDWVQQLCLLIIAVTATVVWSFLDRKRAAYPSLHKLFRVWLCLFLAGEMFGYGADKAIPMQMPGVALARLLEPFGHFSPMGVLWSLIAASKGYEITLGCIEILAGLLLIVPRTALLGALATIMITVDIFLLNMFYDVPVKIFSFQLIWMGIFIAAPDAKRLAKVFFLNRPADPSAEEPLFTRRRWNNTALAVRVVFGLALFVATLWQSWSFYIHGIGGPTPPFYGIWSVKDFTVDSIARPPLLTDDSRWCNVIFERRLGLVAIQTMNQETTLFKPKLDLRDGSLELRKYHRALEMATAKDSDWKADFSLRQPKSNILILDGSYDGHHIHAALQRIDETKFLLLGRGFHWINDEVVNK